MASDPRAKPAFGRYRRVELALNGMIRMTMDGKRAWVVSLRDVSTSDLPVFYEQELDPVANQMAAFTAKDPADRDAFDAHWRKIMRDPKVTIKTILVGDLQVAGYIVRHESFGVPKSASGSGRRIGAGGSQPTRCGRS